MGCELLCRKIPYHPEIPYLCLVIILLYIFRLKTEHAALQCRLPEENEILKQQNSDLWQQLKENEAHLQK